MMLGDAVLRELPNLKPENHEVTSPRANKYNCIAWAAGCDSRWWWPAGRGFWPDGASREVSVSAFEDMFSNLGYVRCRDGSLESGFEKVVLYATRDPAGHPKPTHAAKQLSDGRWTSKLGPCEDICHSSVDDVSGPCYGTPVLYLKRPV